MSNWNFNYNGQLFNFGDAEEFIEVANYAALPATGSTSVIYVTLDDNKLYRWTGSTYVELSAGGGTPSYSVYTALLTQSGSGDDPQAFDNTDNGNLVIGVTYEITNYATGDDFTNVGAPSNANGVKFVATGTTAATWSGATELNYNNGAPIVTVLENTIGNIWFTYDNIGIYKLKSNGLFIYEKTFISNPNTFAYLDSNGSGYMLSDNFDTNTLTLKTYDSGATADGILSVKPIEIRVYN